MFFVSRQHGNLYAQHDSPLPLDTVAAQGNKFGTAGVQVLLPALKSLKKLTHLYLNGTCGDAQWRVSN